MIRLFAVYILCYWCWERLVKCWSFIRLYLSKLIGNLQAADSVFFISVEWYSICYIYFEFLLLILTLWRKHLIKIIPVTNQRRSQCQFLFLSIKNAFLVIINYRGTELELKANITYLGCICLTNRSKNWRKKFIWKRKSIIFCKYINHGNWWNRFYSHAFRLVSLSNADCFNFLVLN